MQDHQIHALARQFKGLWIPAEVVERSDLTAVDKMLWADIDSFSGNDSTWFKSNRRAAKDMGVSERTITRGLTKLQQCGLIRATQFDGRVRHYVSTLSRQIDEAASTNSPDSPAKVSRQTRQSDDIDNNIGKQPRKQPRVSAPELHEVIEFFHEHGSTAGNNFYDYYDSAGWVRKGGVKIKNWKAAARNWMRNESKFDSPKTQRGPKGQGDGITAPGVIDFIANG